jgi:hypothetical protein
MRGGDSSSSDGDGDAAEDDIDNDEVLNVVVAQSAQHCQMNALQPEHGGVVPMPPVHAPDPLHVEPQQPPQPETLAWYLMSRSIQRQSAGQCKLLSNASELKLA